MNATTSIILPVGNQAEFIADILFRFSAAMSEVPETCELIAVVNGSTDGSLAICERVAGELPSLRVLHSTRAGWGHAVKLGLGAASGEILCYTNSARTQPSDLLRCLSDYREHPDGLVKACRQQRDSLLRGVGSRLYAAECRLLMGLPVGDINGTPKVFGRVVLEQIELRERGDLIDLEVLLACRRHGIPVREVAIESTRRHGGVSTTNLLTAAGLLGGGVRLWIDELKAHA